MKKYTENKEYDSLSSITFVQKDVSLQQVLHGSHPRCMQVHVGFMYSGHYNHPNQMTIESLASFCTIAYYELFLSFFMWREKKINLIGAPPGHKQDWKTVVK